MRVFPGLGVLCELALTAPAAAAAAAAAAGPSVPGFAHISNLSDKQIEKVEERFRPGQRVRARVTGHRPMDGLAVLSLKPSVVDQHVLSYAGERTLGVREGGLGGWRGGRHVKRGAETPACPMRLFKGTGCWAVPAFYSLWTEVL
jgi:hypothetical protein